MAIPQHLDDAVGRLKEASARIVLAREQPFTAETQKAWLVALSEFCQALSEIQEYNNESVHEKLHELASRVGLRHFPSGGSPRT